MTQGYAREIISRGLIRTRTRILLSDERDDPHLGVSARNLVYSNGRQL